MKTSIYIFLSLLILTMFAKADDCTSPSEKLHAIIKSNLSNLANSPIELVHYQAKDLEQLYSANTIDQALTITKSLHLDAFIESTTKSNQSQNTCKIDPLALSKKPLTIVIVPGIFGEFIPVRAFEDLFSRNSTYNVQYARQMDAAFANSDANAMDESFDLQAFQNIKMPLKDLVQATSIDNSLGNPMLKVVLLFTPFGSTETLGDTAARAKIFNRRLQKYINITGDQNLVLLGYSRGTDFALEMLSQAQKQNLNYLKNVKGMISYAGVVSGSSLADELDNPDSENAKMVASLKATLAKLEKVPANDLSWYNPLKLTYDAQVAYTVAKNNKAWAEFLLNVLKIKNPKISLSDIMKDISQPGALQMPRMDLDVNGPLMIMRQMFLKLGLNKFAAEYNNNIDRFTFFANQTITGASQLMSSERMKWWKTHTVPESVRYYSMPAVMADPKASDLQNKAFTSRVGYSDSYDDSSLLDNYRKYVSLSGQTLNDSQVSVAQAMFLPKVISGLNPEQKPMTAKLLGIAGSHHWGITLEVVNQMQDGRLNPFPRQQMLLSLGQFISQDLLESGN